jgi:hypothetical protein
MGIIEVTDNFLEKDFIIFLNEYFLNMPHYYGHYSNYDSNSNRFYTTSINFNDPIINFLCKKIFKKNIKILRSYINVQHIGMDGNFHEDDGDQTYLMMISNTLNEKSGEFQIIDKDNKIKSFSFIQNRLISFPAKLKHRGLAPLEKNIPRITLVFKTESIYG